MQLYVNICTAFEKNNRNIKELSNIYNDVEMLKKLVRDVASPIIESNKMFNKRVLLKPNWVREDLVSSDSLCLRTNDAFLLAVVEETLKCHPDSILIADAPIQGCSWDKVVTKDLCNKINFLMEKYSIPVFIKDFRKVEFNPDQNKLREKVMTGDEYVIFDLGENSYLEPISYSDIDRFRVTLYDPDEFAKSHSRGMHKYCIARDFFNADIVISLPKIKTHQKAGLTAALKNIVGLNVDKNYLPHHRIGGTKQGGDCYPGYNVLRNAAEQIIDKANRCKGKLAFSFYFKIASILWMLSLPSKYDNPAAGWFGNDTTWRMVMDLNTIIKFGTVKGTIATDTEREFYSLGDGIIGGQGNGPLSPEPLPLDVVSFSNSSALHDLSMARLMGIQADCVPLLVAASELISCDTKRIYLNKNEVDFEMLKEYEIKASMPPGWKGYERN